MTGPREPPRQPAMIEVGPPMPRPPRRYRTVCGIRVDLKALGSLSHQCRPARCRFAAKCCNSYEVFVDPKERRRITGYLNDAAIYAPGLYEDGGFTEPFEDTEGGKCLATNENGMCIFAFRNSKNHLLCSLHAAAQDHGLHGYAVKPMACAIWPLYYLESDPPLLTVQEGVTKFPCNSRRKGEGKELDLGVAGIIRDFWGSELLAGIERALARK